MKKNLLVIVLIISGLLFAGQASSQVRVRVNVNIGSQPAWGPVGYDAVEYYYLPDIESYYCIPSGLFVYLSSGRWIFSASLPSRYAGYDLYGGYKVVINRPNAYRYFNDDRIRYSGYRNYYGRQTCRHYDDRGYSRYHDNDDDQGWGNGHGHGKKKGHWKHGRWDD